MRTIATAVHINNKGLIGYAEISTELENYKDIFKELTKEVESLNMIFEPVHRIINYVNIVIINESIYVECVGEINCKDFTSIIHWYLKDK